MWLTTGHDRCYNTHTKKERVISKVTVNHAQNMNEFEMLIVQDYMDKRYPDLHYTMTPGNKCIWVYYGNINLYFLFRDGKLIDIQVD